VERAQSSPELSLNGVWSLSTVCICLSRFLAGGRRDRDACAVLSVHDMRVAAVMVGWSWGGGGFRVES